jgi:hypothetical protein
MISADTLRHILVLAERAVVAFERQADAMERLALLPRKGQPVARFRDPAPTADTPGDEVRG